LNRQINNAGKSAFLYQMDTASRIGLAASQAKPTISRINTLKE
jgi:hypothetical protein